MKVAKVLLGKSGAFRLKEASVSGEWSCGIKTKRKLEKKERDEESLRWKSGKTQRKKNLNGQHNDFP